MAQTFLMKHESKWTYHIKNSILPSLQHFTDGTTYYQDTFMDYNCTMIEAVSFRLKFLKSWSKSFQMIIGHHFFSWIDVDSVSTHLSLLLGIIFNKCKYCQILKK